MVTLSFFSGAVMLRPLFVAERLSTFEVTLKNEGKEIQAAQCHGGISDS